MSKKSFGAAALSMLILSSSFGMALPASAGEGVQSYNWGSGGGSTPPTGSTPSTAAPPATAPQAVDSEDPWPWMKKESNVVTPPPKATTETVKEAPAAKESAAASEKETAKTGSPSQAKEFGSVKESAAAKEPTAKETRESSSAGAASTTSSGAKRPAMLYGRIEEITAAPGAKFPIVLKAMTPKLDTSTKPGMSGAVSLLNTNLYSGKVVTTFPQNYRGTWGGNLQLQQMQLDPSYYQLDREEAYRTAQAMRPGMTGSVNFIFQNLSTAKVALDPAQILFMVPGKDTQVADQMKAMFGGGAGNPMAAMASQMAQNMPVPIVLHFGEASTNGTGETGVSGNKLAQRVLSNSIRQLEPGVMEQQIVCQKTTWLKGTGAARTSYGETVIRFTNQGPGRMYVQAATVDYGANRHFLNKMVLGGYVQQGVAMQTDPYAAMGGMGGLGGLGGAGGLGGLEKMFGGGMPGGGQQPNMQQMQQQMQQLQGLPGLDSNMLKGIFGQ